MMIRLYFPDWGHVERYANQLGPSDNWSCETERSIFTCSSSDCSLHTIADGLLDFRYSTSTSNQYNRRNDFSSRLLNNHELIASHPPLNALTVNREYMLNQVC